MKLAYYTCWYVQHAQADGGHLELCSRSGPFPCPEKAEERLAECRDEGEPYCFVYADPQPPKSEPRMLALVPYEERALPFRRHLTRLQRMLKRKP